LNVTNDRSIDIYLQTDVPIGDLAERVREFFGGRRSVNSVFSDLLSVDIFRNEDSKGIGVTDNFLLFKVRIEVYPATADVDEREYLTSFVSLARLLQTAGTDIAFVPMEYSESEIYDLVNKDE